MDLWIGLSLGIITGLFLALWLKERPIFRCSYCRFKTKYQQQHCSACGRGLQWNWFQKKALFLSRYQTGEQFRKWDIFVPTIAVPLPDKPTE